MTYTEKKKSQMKIIRLYKCVAKIYPALYIPLYGTNTACDG